METKLKIEQVSRVARPSLGTKMSVALWRTVTMVVMPDIYGKKSTKELYKIGYRVGELLTIKSIDDIALTIFRNGIGVVESIKDIKGVIIVDYYECMSCSGIAPPVGRPLCFFEKGLTAGIIEGRLKKKILKLEETKCIGGFGDVMCRIEVTYK